MGDSSSPSSPRPGNEPSVTATGRGGGGVLGTEATVQGGDRQGTSSSQGADSQRTSSQAGSERTERAEQQEGAVVTIRQSQSQPRQPPQSRPTLAQLAGPPPPKLSPPPRRRSFFSRFAFRPHARTVADFHIRPAEPHRKYVAGDHVLGHVVLAVVKPLRITHLTVSLRGLVRVFKDPAAAAAPVPTDTAADATSGHHHHHGGGGGGISILSSSSSSSPLSPSSSSSSYLGNGHAILFRDEVVLSGTGRLEPGKYEFGFDLIFPSQGLPSSIDFERGSISYLITATLTRPTPVAPVQSCERKVYLVDPVDVGAVSKPRPRTISLEPISKKSRRRKIVVTQRPQATTTNSATSQTPLPTTSLPNTNTPNIAGQHQGTTIPRSSTSAASAGDGAFSDRGSVRGSSHELQIDGSVATGDDQDGGSSGQAQSQTLSQTHSQTHFQLPPQHQQQQQQPRSPIPTDIRSEFSADSVASGGTSLSGRGGSGSGSGSVIAGGGGGGGAGGAGAGGGAHGSESAQSGRVRLASPAGSQTGSVSHNMTVRQGTGGPGSQTSGTEERTITATIELLKGGCLPGDVVSVKVAVQHVKRIKSLHGVVVTLYRQGRIDSAPPPTMFGMSTVTASSPNRDDQTGGANQLEEIPEGQPGGANDNGVLNGGQLGSRQNAATNGHSNGEPNGSSASNSGHNRRDNQSEDNPPKQKQKQRRQRHDSKSDHRNAAHDPHHENYYPKSKTGLGGLSLTSAGSCSVFRKDLSQSFSPLIIDPRTLQSSVTASVRVPEDAFATIKGVPGEMISFKYNLEVIVDLGGKLASLLQSSGQSGGGTGGGSVGVGGPLGAATGGGLDGTKPPGAGTTPLWGGASSSSHMVDTDQLRRQKGVIYVSFEVVVGTTDSSRTRARGGTGLSRPEIPPLDYQQYLQYQQYYQQYYQQHQQQHQQQQDPPYPPPPPPPPPGWFFPDDRKDGGRQQQTNGQPAVTDAGPAGDQYYQQHPPHQPYYDLYDANGGPSRPGPSAPNPYAVQQPDYLPPPPVEAPQYVPTAAMVAADNNLSEKERIRRAEERLLPSQPGGSGQPSASGPSAPSGSSEPSGDAGPSSAPSAPPVVPGPDYASQAPLHAPSAPTVEELALPPLVPAPSMPYASGSGSASASAAAYAHPPGGQPATEDKQELERRRLLAEASAPPDFPDDYEDGGGPSAPPAGPSAPSAPSAPVLDDEPEFVPSLEVVTGGASQSQDQNAGARLDETEEDRYGQHYAYGPSTSGPAGANVGSAAAPAEPLPRYER